MVFHCWIMFNFGQLDDLHFIIQSGLIARRRDANEGRQTVFFTAVDHEPSTRKRAVRLDKTTKGTVQNQEESVPRCGMLDQSQKLLCSPCVPDIHRLVHIPCQCSCTLLSAPLLMRAWHSLRITIKVQTQKHIVHWTHLLRAFPCQKCSAVILDDSLPPTVGVYQNLRDSVSEKLPCHHVRHPKLS